MTRSLATHKDTKIIGLPHETETATIAMRTGVKPCIEQRLHDLETSLLNNSVNHIRNS